MQRARKALESAPQVNRAQRRDRLALRIATANDAPSIARTHCKSWRTTYPGLVPQRAIDEWANETARTEGWAKNLADDDQTVWLAYDLDQPCLGFVSFGETRTKNVRADAQIRALYLLQSAQRRGIGKTLLMKAFGELIESGYASACVEVLSGNGAEAFYQHLGAQFVRAEAFEMSGCPLTEHIYVWPDLKSTLQKSAPQI